MIVKVGLVTLRVSYHLVKKVGDTENYGFAIQQIVNTKIARTWKPSKISSTILWKKNS